MPAISGAYEGTPDAFLHFPGYVPSYQLQLWFFPEMIKKL